MAQFFDGYEQFRTVDSPSSAMGWAGYTVRGDISAGGGRIGSSVALITLKSAFEREWAWGGDLLTVGFACRQAARGPIFGLKAGAATGRDNPFILAYVDPVSALVTLTTGDDLSDVGYVTPLPGRWYFYEFEINRAAKTVQVFVNGKADVSYPLPDQIAASASVRMVFNPFDMMPGGFPSDSPYIEDAKTFDDMYAQDGGRIGPIQISGRLPTGDRTTEWGTSSSDPSGAHFSMVGTLPPSVSDRFIYTGTTDKTDSFISAQTLPDNGAIISQGVIALVRKSTADPVSVIANVDGNAVSMDNISRKWEYRYTLMPAGGYDKTAIEAAEFGVKSVIS